MLKQPKHTLLDLGVEFGSSNVLTIVFRGQSSSSQCRSQEELDSALQQAGADGNADKVDSLLSEGGDPNNYDGSKGTRQSALNGAASNGHQQCVELLLDAKADIDSKAYCGCTPLHQTCLYNRIDIARRLVQARADLNVRCKHGSPLDIAIHREHNEIRRMLENANKE